MKKIFFAYLLLLVSICNAQNVGIGTNTPGFPLNFSTSVGDKISLYGNNGDHYGFGVQGGLLQIHSDAQAANIAFGFGSSANFTERMRIVNNGEYGMQMNGRILLRNGTNPINTGYGPGIWLTKSDNTSTLGFMGVQDNQNMGFYGGPAGWGFTYDAVNSRVGIGNQNPNAPLSFSASLGKKITLYPGAAGNVGIGVYGNELRLHTDYEPADITLGYENLAGIFTERFRFKGSGAMAVNGNTGNSGQVLQSNGNINAPSWANIARPSVISFIQSGNTVMGGGLEVAIAGLAGSFFLNQPSTVIFQGQLNILNANVTFTGFGYTEIQILNALNNVVASGRSTASMAAVRKTSMNPVGAVSLPGGIYSVRTIMGRLNVADLHPASFSEAPGQVILQIIPN